METFRVDVQKGQWLRVAITAVVSSLMLCEAYSQSAKSLEIDEVARRSENALLASELVKKADSEYNMGDFAAAHESYQSALALLSRAPSVGTYRDAIAERYGNAATELARNYMRVGKGEEARQILKAVLAPEVAEGHIGAKTMLARLDDPIRNNPAASLAHTQAIDKVAKGLRRAEGYMELAVYDKALVEYEEVLRLDSYNVAARRGMEQIHRLKSQYYNAAYDEARARALMEVDQSWELAVLPKAESLNGSATGRFQEGLVLSREEEIRQKMKRIIIPVVDLEQVTLDEVGGLLEGWSREYDTLENDPNKKGLNVIMDLGDPSSDEGQLLRARSFNLKLSNIPFEGVVGYIADQAGLSWRAGEYAVEIRPVGTFGSDLITRSFKVPPSFLLDVAKDGDSGGGDPFQLQSEDSGIRLSRLSPQEYLEQHGVTFPDGARVNYISASNTVTMTNTADNLDVLEQLVDSLTSVEDISVVVKMTVIDVRQSDLEEIGFDWLLTPAPGGGTRVIGGTVGNGTPPPQIAGAAGAPLTSGLRTGTGINGGDPIDAVINTSLLAREASFGEQRAPSILGLNDEINDATVQAVLSGLSQKTADDTIWQPSVVTRSGETAVVLSAREFPYPEEYEPPELPNSVGSNFGQSTTPVVPATPTSFATRNLGVRMEVEPTVSADKKHISLRVNPQISEFDGFVNYGSPIRGDNGVGGIDTITENAILMPVFSSIGTNTAVTIYDGSTIAIGGLMRQTSTLVEDKVPVLGSLPIVGRFFQRTGKVPETRALVIFVKAELVDPTGARINP